MQVVSPNKNIQKRLELDDSFKELGYKSIVVKSSQTFVKKTKKQMWLTFYSFNLNTGPMEECKYYLYSNIYIYVMPMVNILLFSDCSIVFTLRGQRIKVASHVSNL